MRATLALGIIGLGVLNLGCAMVGSGVDHVVYAAKESVEDHLERARYRRWAADAWPQAAADGPAAGYSEDYADGFRDGFVDYVDGGGTGEPPPLPPRRYQGLRYQSPEGYQAIEDWFAGYRHGAAVARQGPYREWITGPSSLRGPTGTLSLEVPGASLPPAAPDGGAPAGMPEQLPLPKKAPPAPAGAAASPPPAEPDRAGTQPLYYRSSWQPLRPAEQAGAGNRGDERPAERAEPTDAGTIP